MDSPQAESCDALLLLLSALSFSGSFDTGSGHAAALSYALFSMQIHDRSGCILSCFFPRLFLLSVFLWSCQTDSNPRPADYKSAALPTELWQHTKTSESGNLSDASYSLLPVMEFLQESRWVGLRSRHICQRPNLGRCRRLFGREYPPISGKPYDN